MVGKNVFFFFLQSRDKNQRLDKWDIKLSKIMILIVKNMSKIKIIKTIF